MPDRDYVYGKLPRIYTKPYKMLCGGKESAGFRAMGSLRRELKKFGDVPIHLAKEIAEAINPVAGATPIERQATDWGKTKEKVRECIRENSANRRYVNAMVQKATDEVLHALRYEGGIAASNLEKRLVKGYMRAAYETRFEGRIPMTDDHPNDITNQEVRKRLREIRPEIEVGIAAFADKACEENSVENLRRPNRKSINRPDDPEENLL